MADSSSRLVPAVDSDTLSSESEDMDFELATDEESDNATDTDFFERLLAGEETGDMGGTSKLHSILFYSINLPQRKIPADEFAPHLALAEIEVEIEEAEDEEADDTETERSEQYNILTLVQTLLLIFRYAAARQRRQVMRLLANSEIGRLFHLNEDNDSDLEDDDEDFQNPIFRRRRRRTRPDPDRFPKVPSDNGVELMNSGTFGSNEVHLNDSGSISKNKKKKLARRILDRELATEGYAQQRVNQRLMAQVGLSHYLTVTLLN